MGFFGSSVGCLTGFLIFLWQITLLGCAGPPPAHKLLAVRAALPLGCIFLLSIPPLANSPCFCGIPHPPSFVTLVKLSHKQCFQWHVSLVRPPQHLQRKPWRCTVDLLLLAYQVTHFMCDILPEECDLQLLKTIPLGISSSEIIAEMYLGLSSIWEAFFLILCFI